MRDARPRKVNWISGISPREHVSVGLPPQDILAKCPEYPDEGLVQYTVPSVHIQRRSSRKVERSTVATTGIHELVLVHPTLFPAALADRKDSNAPENLKTPVRSDE